MELKVRRWLSFLDERLEEAGRRADQPYRRAAVAALIENPFAGRYVEDLKPLIDASPQLGEAMADRLMATFGPLPVMAYGKAGVVGVGGEQEHANALLTTVAAEPLRKAIGGGKAWISSVTKIGGPGLQLDVPLASKDALYVRSLYDAMTLYFADGPRADEIVLVFAVSGGPRLNARVGGLKVTDIRGEDGLV